MKNVNLSQIAEMQESKDRQEKKTALELAEEQKIRDLQKQQRFVRKIRAEVACLDLRIINNLGTIFTPVLDFKIDSLHSVVQQSNLLTSVSAEIHLALEYYNPQVSEWEPIVESIQVSADVIMPVITQTTVMVKIDDALNLTVSTQLFKVLLQMITLMKIKLSEAAEESQAALPLSADRPLQLPDKRDAEPPLDKSAIQIVSPYTVTN